LRFYWASKECLNLSNSVVAYGFYLCFDQNFIRFGVGGNNHAIDLFWVNFACFVLLPLFCFPYAGIYAAEIESMKLEIATIKGDIKALEGKMATKDDLLSLWKDMMGKMETLYGLIIGVLFYSLVFLLIKLLFLKEKFGCHYR